MRVRSILTASALSTIALGALAPAADADECSPPRVMVVLDKSSSMRTGTIGGATKWSLAVGALDTVMAELEAQAEVGLMTFPRPNQCGPGGLDVAPALDNRAEIIGALATPPPTAGNWTPMAQTLDAAAIEPTLVGADAPRYVILISDGWQWCDPYDAGTRYDGVDAIGRLNGTGVTTFVVGFGGATDASALNLMAVEAGTARAGCDPSNDAPSDLDQCYYQADSSAELIAALMDIAGNVTVETCDGEDNDCDGLIDEGLDRACATDCGTGSEVCVAGVWQGCDAPAPAAETCDGVDNDCDGSTDPGCDCTPGASRACGETEDEGACSPGTQTCDASGHWGDCAGSVGPGNEMCDGLDNDCDGRVDEWAGSDDVGGNLCDPGFECVGGGCEPLDPVSPPIDEEDPGAGFDEGTPAGCGCTTGEGPGAGALLVLLLGVIALRRRRT